jgi:hypothetical protein
MKSLVVIIFCGIMLGLTVTALGQERQSLKSLQPGTKYVNAKGGYSIGLPKPDSADGSYQVTTQDSSGTWRFKEGTLRIKVIKNLRGVWMSIPSQRLSLASMFQETVRQTDHRFQTGTDSEDVKINGVEGTKRVLVRHRSPCGFLVVVISGDTAFGFIGLAEPGAYVDLSELYAVLSSFAVTR